MTDALPVPILTLRGIPVLIDADLARLYGVPTKRLNEQVRRNQERFPADFLFELTPQEKAEVVANCDHLQNLKFSKALPHAFTEHGALMAANVLNSAEAVKMSVFIILSWLGKKRGVREQRDFAILTAEISKATFGMTPSEYKAFEALANPKDNRASILAKLPKRGESHA